MVGLVGRSGWLSTGRKRAGSGWVGSGKNPCMDELTPIDTAGSVFLRGEALAAGYRDREITQLVSAKEWHRLRRGAYVARAIWDQADESQRHALLASAVLKQARTDLVLSHVSALPAYGAPLWNLRLDVVHVTRRDQRAGRHEAGVHQHQGILLPGDVITRDSLEYTHPTRTALDVTTVADTETSLCVVNHLLHAGLTTLQDMAARYESMNRNPHTLKTDLVLRLADPRVESAGESRTFFMCWRHGLPAPEPQYAVRDAGGREVARLDFAWPEYGVWLEFDGREKYTKHLRDGETTTAAVLREKRREDRVRELTGWRCIRITWADLMDPARTVARIRALLVATSQAS